MKQVSEAVGVSESTISRWESGAIANMTREKIVLLSKALKLSPADIMGWTKDTPKEDTIVVLDDYRYYEVPRFDSIAAGFGVIADSNPIGTDLLPFKNESEAAETMTIKVTGDSMYPKIEDGDVIAVKKQTSVDSGTVAAVLIDGQDAVVKKVTYGDDWIILHSFNPEYMDREFRGADVQRIRIMGKVTKIIKEM
jgi:repressor LexA